MSDDELFGNDEMDNFDDQNEIDENNCGYNQEDSDIDQDEIYGPNDFFGRSNSVYLQTHPFSLIDPPSDNRPFFYPLKNLSSSNNVDGQNSIFYQYRYSNEKVNSIENSESERNTTDFEKLTLSQTINSYIISNNLKFDYMHSKYDYFSKKHHREKLFGLINKINWENKSKINDFKKEINPYEEIFEGYFHRNSSYKLANINSIMNFKLLEENFLRDDIPMICIGDDGGFTDYILWFSHKNNFNPKIIVIPEKEMKFEKTKFREEIHNVKDEKIKLLNHINGCDFDDVKDISSYKLKLITHKIKELINEGSGIEEQGLSLFIAKKYIKYKNDISQEIQNKKFILTNLILAFNSLTRGGTFVIKIYDMYTPFTISILYILYNHFSKFTIIKPFSTRPHTNSKYVICYKFLEQKPKILDYLFEFYDKYINLIKTGKDCEFVFPINKIIKDEQFMNYIMEMNSNITEKRIESLEDLKNAMDMNKVPQFDKMDLKKRCLDSWKIPVLNYDESKLLCNKFKKPESKIFNNISNKNSNKPKTLKETAYLYSDYDKNSDSMQSLLNIFERGSKTVYKLDEKKDKEDKLKKLDAILNSDFSSDKGLEKLLGKKRENKKPLNKDKDEKTRLDKDKYSYYYEETNINKKEEKHYNSNEKNYKIEGNNEQKFNKIIIKKRDDDEIKPNKYNPSKQRNDNKKYYVSKESHISARISNDEDVEMKLFPLGKVSKEKIVEETLKNRILMENKKITINADLKAELERFKKKN